MTGKYNSSFDIREPRCVKCNSKNIKRLSASANRMEYHCQDCQKCFKGEICVVNDVSLKSSSKNVIQCPRCNDLNIIFGGKRRNKTQLKQSYICKNCGRHFVENAKYFSSKYLLEGNISLEKMCQGDIWDIRILGLEPRANQNYTLNFSKIKPDWLKSATKKWIKQKSSTASGATLLTYLVGIRKFSNFIVEKSLSIQAQDIDRNLIIDYFSYLLAEKIGERIRSQYISHLNTFLTACSRFKWLALTNETLIYPEDYPKTTKRIPRYIPETIIQQSRDKYHVLPQTIICMIEVLLNTGMRVSELCLLRINCLERDSTGSYWLKIYQKKMKKEIFIPIDKKLAEIIFQQQKFIKDNLGEDWKYLFCNTKKSHNIRQYKLKNKSEVQKLKPLNYFEPSKQIIKYKTICDYLTRFANEMNIRDDSGEIFPLSKLHQFRHTHATDLINAGVPQHIIQKRLGHASPHMTSVYAHIHDKTMKKEMEKFWDGKVVNNQGQVIVSENPELDTVEMQWIKRNMKAQTLPDGFCALPVTKSCPVQGSPCLSCSHFRTTKDFLEVHKMRLEDTEKLIENARINGWNRQIETNLPIAENLKNIIRGLSEKEVVYGNENFAKKQGGEENA